MGAHNMPEWFVPKYRDEVKIRAQQTKRKLDGMAEDGGMFIGDKLYMPRFGQVETYTAQRLAELRLANAAMDWVEVEAKPEFIAFGIWDPDKNKLNINVASQFAQASVKAVNRARDRQHIEALKRAAADGVKNTKNVVETITTIGDYDTVATLETIVEAIVKLGTDEMFENESINVIAPFKLRTQLALDPYLAKTDIKTNRPWDDLRWASYEKLPGNGATGEGWLSGGATGVDMFIHATGAVVTAQNDGDVDIQERLGGSLGDMIGQWFQSGSAVVEPKGVIRIKSKLDFTLERRMERVLVEA